METIHRGVLILHGFAQPDLPEHKGLTAVDLDSGTILWHSDGLTFWFIDGDTVYGYRPTAERRIACALSLRTGAVEKEFREDIDALFGLQSRSIPEAAALVFPRIFGEEPLEGPHRDLIEKKLRRDRTEGNVEFVDHHGFLIVSHHERESVEPGSGVLRNLLDVVRVEDGRTVYSDTMSRGRSSPVPDSFFLHDGFVYYVKDQSILIAVNLWKS